MLSPLTNAKDIKWAPVNMELGCVPFSDLYNSYPELSGAKTPEKILSALKSKHTDVKLLPFIELNAEEVTEEEKQQREKSPAYKLYTKSNAIFISWGKNESADGVLIYTEELCQSIYKKS